MVFIISVTEKGDEIAKKICENLKQKSSVFFRVDVLKLGIKNIVSSIFSKCEGIIFISSTGIAVRSIAPFVKDKREDPGIVVVDCLGKYSISLLSGHIGGANSLSLDVSNILSCKSIITTGTDINNVVAPDILGKNNNLFIEDNKLCKEFSVAIVNGENIHFLDEAKIVECPRGYQNAYDFTKESDKLIYISNQNENEIFKKYKKILKLTRKNIVLGIGCRKNIDIKFMEDRVFEFLMQNNISKNSIKAITSIDIKSKEEGILNLQKKLNCIYQTFSKDEINNLKDECEKSEFVKSKIGVFSVAEPCVLLFGGKIIVPKTILGGITICVGEI